MPVRRDNLFHLIYIGEHTRGKKQTVEVESVKQLIGRIQTADMHIALRMDETMVAYVNADMDNPFFPPCRLPTAEKQQVACLEIASVWRDLDPLAHVCLLGSVPWHQDVMQIQHRAHKPLQSMPFEDIPAHK